MNWLSQGAHVVGGAALANAIPHLVGGLMGRPLQSPFASPPGKGLSSATVNVLWGVFNLAVAYALVLRVGTFELRRTSDVLALGVGFMLMSIKCARSFGRFYGGNAPDEAERPRPQ